MRIFGITILTTKQINAHDARIKATINKQMATLMNQNTHLRAFAVQIKERIKRKGYKL